MPLNVQDVLQFLGRFDRLAAQLSRRSKGKPLFALEDEYDVQDLVFATLKPLVTDLTKENPSPKVANAGGRVDLFSGSLGLVIEIKATLKRAARSRPQGSAWTG